MPTEDELRDLLRGEPAPNRLDAKRVVSASRRRRIPQQVAAGSLGTLAVAAIAVFGIQSAQFGQITADSASAPMVQESEMSDGDLAYGTGESLKRLPADRINLCGAPVAETVPSPSGLQLDVIAPGAAAAGTAPVEAVVRLTNIGSEPVAGTTFSAPSLTLSQDGIVLWHSNGVVGTADVRVDLQPGESISYTAAFAPVQCAPDDDALPEFRPDLPALPAGAYELSAVIDFASDNPGATPELDLVTGPRAPLALQ